MHSLPVCSRNYSIGSERPPQKKEESQEPRAHQLSLATWGWRFHTPELEGWRDNGEVCWGEGGIRSSFRWTWIGDEHVVQWSRSPPSLEVPVSRDIPASSAHVLRDHGHQAHYSTCIGRIKVPAASRTRNEGFKQWDKILGLKKKNEWGKNEWAT